MYVHVNISTESVWHYHHGQGECVRKMLQADKVWKSKEKTHPCLPHCIYYKVIQHLLTRGRTKSKKDYKVEMSSSDFHNLDKKDRVGLEDI